MMPSLLLLLQAAAVPAPVVNVQMSCTLASPVAPLATVSVDLRTKKPGTAALVGEADSPWSRVSATSDTVMQANGSAAFTFATGAGQYRLELAFTGTPSAGLAKARLIALGGAGGPVRYAQGFCTPRSGKRLAPKNLVRLPFDGTPIPRATGAAQVQPVPAELAGGVCRLVTPDRQSQSVRFAITTARDNEANTTYQFDRADLLGKQAAAGTGVRFHLATGSEHVVTMTQLLDTTPAAYAQTSYERSGTWIELTREGRTLAWGECGPTPTAILMPSPGKTNP